MVIPRRKRGYTINSLAKSIQTQLKFLQLQNKKRTDTGRITISLSHSRNDKHFYIQYHEVFFAFVLSFFPLLIMSFIHNLICQNLTQSVFKAQISSPFQSILWQTQSYLSTIKLLCLYFPAILHVLQGMGRVGDEGSWKDFDQFGPIYKYKYVCFALVTVYFCV